MASITTYKDVVSVATPWHEAFISTTAKRSWLSEGKAEFARALPSVNELELQLKVVIKWEKSDARISFSVPNIGTRTGFLWIGAGLPASFSCRLFRLRAYPWVTSDWRWPYSPGRWAWPSAAWPRYPFPPIVHPPHGCPATWNWTHGACSHGGWERGNINSCFQKVRMISENCPFPSVFPIEAAHLLSP